MLWANRNGFFYVLDRTTGKFLLGKPFVEGELGERLRRNTAGPCACRAKFPRRKAP